MIAFTLALLLMTSGDEVLPAYSQDDNRICVDVPAGLVDWEALARKKLGNARIDHPHKAFLRKHETGYGPRLELKVAPTTAITGRVWNILHETGLYRLHPDHCKSRWFTAWMRT